MKWQVKERVMCGICVHGQVIHPHLPETTHTCIPNSCVGNMLTLCTYNTNVSREPKLSKYMHVSQIMYNGFNKHIDISCHDSWMRCSLNALLIHLYMFMSRLLLTCHLDSCPDVHTLLRAALGGCRGERPQHSTGPLAKTFHIRPIY